MLNRVQASSDSVFCTLQPLNARLNTLHIELLGSQRFRFGRHEECEQCFPSDYRISSLHASLVRDVREDGAPCVSIEDSSVNGTYVNAARVPKGRRQRLRTGDELYLVIPSQEMLHQTGYEGSLMGKFIGYRFAYTSAEEMPGNSRLSGAVVDESSASAARQAMGETEPTAAGTVPGSPLEQMKEAVRDHSASPASTVAGRAGDELSGRPPPILVGSPGGPADSADAPAGLDSSLVRRVHALASEQFQVYSAATDERGGEHAGGGGGVPAGVIGSLGPNGELPAAVSFALWWGNGQAVERSRPAWAPDASDIQARHLVGSPWRAE